MIYYVLFCHWLHDFIGQNYFFPSLEIGKNKSKDGSILFFHVLMYTLGMMAMLLPFVSFQESFLFAFMNGASHLVIDAITSRLSSWAYSKQDFKLFWTVIGFDQFLHVAILCATLTS